MKEVVQWLREKAHFRFLQLISSSPTPNEWADQLYFCEESVSAAGLAMAPTPAEGPGQEDCIAIFRAKATLSLVETEAQVRRAAAAFRLFQQQCMPDQEGKIIFVSVRRDGLDYSPPSPSVAAKRFYSQHFDPVEEGVWRARDSVHSFVLVCARAEVFKAARKIVTKVLWEQRLLKKRWRVPWKLKPRGAKVSGVLLSAGRLHALVVCREGCGP